MAADLVQEHCGSTVTVGGVTGRLLAVSEGGGPTLVAPWVGVSLLPAGASRSVHLQVPPDTPVEASGVPG